MDLFAMCVGSPVPDTNVYFPHLDTPPTTTRNNNKEVVPEILGVRFTVSGRDKAGS